jgi:hypothetical protein
MRAYRIDHFGSVDGIALRSSVGGAAFDHWTRPRFSSRRHRGAIGSGRRWSCAGCTGSGPSLSRRSSFSPGPRTICCEDKPAREIRREVPREKP